MNHLHYQTHAKPILSSTHTAFFFFFFLAMNYQYWQVVIFFWILKLLCCMKDNIFLPKLQMSISKLSIFPKERLTQLLPSWSVTSSKMAQQPHSLTLDEGKNILTSQLLCNLPTIVSPSTSASWWLHKFQPQSVMLYVRNITVLE